MPGLRPDWLTFRRLAATTTALTLGLVMLGIYTAATGSGLACSAQWPLCDGGVLPQTLPSFVEWFHRLVAMVTGWFILGTAALAWRRDADRRARYAATAAVVLLPLQIGIGAVTVTLSGLVPGGYAPSTQGAHFVTALAIFTALVLVTLFAYGDRLERDSLTLARRALAAAAVGLPASALLGRAVPLLAYEPAAQAAFYGASLAVYAAALAATLWLGRTGLGRLRAATGAALALLVASMLLGRDLLAYTPAVRLANLALVAAAWILLAGAAAVAHRADGREEEPGAAATGSAFRTR